MAESKVQTIARRGGPRTSIGTYLCGGELIWAQVGLLGPGRMKICEMCAVMQPRTAD